MLSYGEYVIEWKWCHFRNLTADEVYSILAARQSVFIVEQNCPYLDADGYDQQSYHSVGWGKGENGETILAAYARFIPPAIKYPELAIGRVITTKFFRGKGVGIALLEKTVERAEETFPDSDMYLSAQAHLQRYYQRCNFGSSGDSYDEDGIPHIAMFRK